MKTDSVPSAFRDTDFEPSTFAQVFDPKEAPSGHQEVRQAVTPSRRKQDYHPPCGPLLAVQERLERGDVAIHAIRTAQTRLQTDTAEVLEILHSAKHFFRITRWVGSIVVWLTPIAALWVGWKGLGK